MDPSKKYFAFISYKREDEKWAKWLQHKLEHYYLPVNVRRENPSLPQVIRPIFKDTSELAAGVLADEIHEALENSRYLIVVCSPRSAQSQWVGKEVQTFIDMGRSDKIIPFIIGGTPFSDNIEEECFPSALLNLPQEQELLGVNINEMGREAAVVKVVARMFGLKFDTLWQRHEREQKKRRWIILGGSIALAIISFVIVGWIWHQNTLLKEKDWKIKENLAKAVAEKANQLIEEGDSYTARLILQEIEPKSHYGEDGFPYTIEWESSLRKACQYNSAIFHGSNCPVYSICYSPNGRLIASSDRKGDIRIRETCSGAPIQILKGTGRLVKAITFSPNGKLFAAASNDNTIKIYNCKTWKCNDTIRVNGCYLWAITFSPDSKFLLSDSGDGHIAFWNSKTFSKVYQTFEKHNSIIESFSFSPDGKTIVSGSWDKTVKVWDFNTRRLIHSFEEHTKEVKSVCFNQDGTLIASASDDQSIRIWDCKTKECLDTLFGHNGSVTSICFNKNSTKIISASDDHKIKIWNIKSHKCEKTLDKHSQSINQIAVNPNGMQLASASDDCTIRFWDLETDNRISKTWKLHHPGKNLVFFHKTVKFISSGNPTFMCDIESGDTTNIEYESQFVSISKDDRYALLVDGVTFVVYDIIKKKLSTPILGHSSTINSAIFSTDGRTILTASHDGEVKEWNIQDGVCIKTYTGHKAEVLYATYNPKENVVVSASKDIRIWNRETGQCMDSTLENDMYYRTIDFTPNGKFFLTAVGDNTIRLWNFSSLKNIKTYEGHTDIVWSAFFNHDASKIISSSWDNKCNIWDVKTEKIIDSFNSGNSCASFSYNDQWIVSINGWNIELRKYIPIKTFVKENHKRFKNRQLTPEEKRKYYLE